MKKGKAVNFMCSQFLVSTSSFYFLRSVQTTMCSTIQLLSLFYGISLFVVADAQANQCPGLSFTINSDAEVKFSVITTIRRTTDGVNCGSKLSSAAIENIAAMQWIVDTMNRNNFTVKIGFDVYDDCGIPRNTIARAFDVLDGPVLGSQECASNNYTVCSIGIIGASQSNTTAAMLYALQGSKLPVIGPYATFHNLSQYDNYYRTISTDDIQIQATAKLLSKLGLLYVAVVYMDDEISRYRANKLKEISKAHEVCVDSMQPITNGPDIDINLLKQQRAKTKHNSLRVIFFGTRSVFRNMQTELNFHETEIYNISWIVVEHSEDVSAPFNTRDAEDNNGTIVISPSVNKVQAVNDFIQGKINKVGAPTDDLEQLIKCSGLVNVPNNDIAASMDAVVAFASALQRRAKLHCQGRMEGTVCSELRKSFEFKLDEVIRYPVNYVELNKTNITVKEFIDAARITNFRDDGDYLPGGTEIYDVKVFQTNGNASKVGSYRNNITLSQSASFLDVLPSSICFADCAICDHSSELSFAFLDGQTFILGIFAIHETDPDKPFMCSNFRTSQMDVIIAETFLYSVEQMRSETGIQFGAIAIDDCYSSAQVELVLTRILSREVNLTNPYTESVIPVDRIAAVVMTVSSSVTIPVSLLMTGLKIPVISASASSPDLDDRVNFPYFLRTVPSDIEQAKAMVSIIKQMNWQYVSLMYVENNYGSKGKEALLKIANESKVCIAKSPEGITYLEDENSDSILQSVFTRISNQKADIVVYFGTEARTADFLKAINGQNDFIFLGSEDWGDRQYILDTGKRSTLGSITLKNDVQSLADDPLAQYLRSLKPGVVPGTRNPWFNEYWEENFKCDTPTSFRNVYDKICDDSVKFSEEDIKDFVEDHRIVHTTKAVKAIAHGLKKSKEQFCQFDAVFPCPKYFQYVSDVVANIRNVSLMQKGVATKVFRDSGNGNVGFRINNVQQDSGGSLKYVQVGSYNEGTLNLQVNNLKFYADNRKNFDGACFGTLCDHCFNISMSTTVSIETTTPSNGVNEKFRAPDLTIIGILCGLFLVVVIMSIIIICFFRRRVKELENQMKELKYEIRTGYDLHQNGSGFSNYNTTSITYPELQFANTSPSGDTMYEWRKAQNALNGGNKNFANTNGGVVNKAFVGSETYLHARHDDDENQQSSSSGNQPSPRRQDSNSDQNNSFPDSPVYRPPSSSYGISSHSSFKKPATDYNGNGYFKKQPRTQLAVPPCRPELPPRDSEQQQRTHAQRPTGFTEKFDHLPSAVPKDKIRKGRSSPKRTVSPPSFKQDNLLNESPRHRDTPKIDSTKYNGVPNSMTFTESNLPSQNKINLAGSSERISRV